MPIAPDVYRKIIMAKVYMDENFHEPIDLDCLSREACLSRFHFHRLFTRIYRRTPHQYLTRKRVEQARQWLAGKDLTVSEICNNVGFESIGSFSVLFKKEIGFAPQYSAKSLRFLCLHAWIQSKHGRYNGQRLPLAHHHRA